MLSNRPSVPSPLQRNVLRPPGIDEDAVVALDALLRWARCSGRSFDEVLPLVIGRFAAPDIVRFVDGIKPGAGSLREVFEDL